MLLLRANPAALAPAPAAVPIFTLSTSPAAARATRSFPAARCSVGNLSPVRFEPLRAGPDPDPPSQDGGGVGAGAATTGGEEHEQQKQHNHEDDEGEDQGKGSKQEGISGISVPRQRYIAVPKAALLDVLLPLFPSQPAPAADDFRRFARPVLSSLYNEIVE
jgi:hypothetical protein